MCITFIMEPEGKKRKSVHLQQFSGEELLFSKFLFSLWKFAFYYLLLSRGGQGVESSTQGAQIEEAHWHQYVNLWLCN